MNILGTSITFFTAFLMYKIKLIDDRSTQTIKSCKNYFERNVNASPALKENEKNHLNREFDTWLDKDIDCILIALWKRNNDIAILDYYRTLRDCMIEKREIYLAIVLNIIFLFLYGFELLPTQPINCVQVETSVILVIMIYVCFFKPQRRSLLNNHLISVKDSKEAKRIYDKSVEMIDKDFKKYVKDYEIIAK